MRTLALGAPREFLDRYSIPAVLKEWSLTPDTLAAKILTTLSNA